MKPAPLLLLLLAAVAAGCASGDGARSYVMGDVYVILPPSTNLTVEVLNQHVTSSTGHDRITKPSAEIPVSVTPAP